MKTTTSIPDAGNLPGSIEVKISLTRLSGYILLAYLFFLFAGTALYTYVWEEFTAYSIGHYIGQFWGRLVFPCLLLAFVLLVSLNGLLLFLANGRSLKGLHWHCDWAGTGWHCRRPLPLKYYRIVLLLPGILLGVLPALHGFCTGWPEVYVFGLVCLICSLGDFTLWFKLRPFSDDDLYVSHGRELQGKVIRRGA